MKRKHTLGIGLLAISSLLLVSCGDMVEPGTEHLLRTSSGNTSVVSKGRSVAMGRTKRYILHTAPLTFPIELQVLCGQDNVNMGVTLSWMGQFDTTAEGSDEAAKKKQLESIIAQVKSGGARGSDITLDEYWMNVLDTFFEEEAKQVFSPVEPGEMNAKRRELADSVEQAVTARFKELGFPVKTIGVNLTNLDFPKTITDQREMIAKVRLEDEKNAAQAEADVAAAGREAELMGKKGEARLVEAEKEAAYFSTMAEHLDEKVLILRRLEAAETISGNMLQAAQAAANGNSNTIVITPFGYGDMLGSSGEGQLLLQNSIEKAVAPKVAPRITTGPRAQ